MRWNKRNFGILKVCREKEHGRKKRVTRMEKLQKTITELNDKLKKKNKTPEEQDEEFEQFYECIKDIATHPVVLRMKLYPHHGVTNCYQHCLHVSCLLYTSPSPRD